jgi:hypothetical protein
VADGIAAQDILDDAEDVYRGLPLFHFRDGLPSEGCFIMKARHTLEEGPSHMAANIIPREALRRFEAFSPEKVAIVQLNTGEIRKPVRDAGVILARRPDPYFEEYADAHAVLTGYQHMSSRELKDYQRYLARLAVQNLTR